MALLGDQDILIVAEGSTVTCSLFIHPWDAEVPQRINVLALFIL